MANSPLKIFAWASLDQILSCQDNQDFNYFTVGKSVLGLPEASRGKEADEEMGWIASRSRQRGNHLLGGSRYKSLVGDGDRHRLQAPNSF